MAMAEYIITRVESKRSKVNPWHERVTGKRCTIGLLEFWCCAIFYVRGIDSYDGATVRYVTSRVLRTNKQDGVLTVETENTTYTLERVGGADG